MIILETIMDDVLKKEYDLCLYEYQELKNIVLDSYGMELSELQNKFDPIKRIDSLENELTEEMLKIINKEVIETTNVNLKLHFSRQFDLNNKSFRSVVYGGKGLFLDESLKSVIARLDSDHEKTRNNANKRLNYLLKEIPRLLEDLKDFSREEYIEYNIKKFRNNSDEENDKWLGMSMVSAHNKEITRANMNDFKFKEKYSETLKEYFRKEDTNYSSKESNDFYHNQRNELALHGIEIYPFVIEEYNNKVILIDGFNRLFGTDFNIPNKKIIVKVYKDLTTLEYSKLLYLQNDWKISKPIESSEYSKRFSEKEKFNKEFTESFLNRGVRASLFFKYDLDDVHLNQLGYFDFEKDFVANIKYYKKIESIVSKFMYDFDNNDLKNKIIHKGFHNYNSADDFYDVLYSNKDDILNLVKYSRKSVMDKKLSELI